MKKPWSISTTVRNPDRLRDFLRVLKGMEGQPFNLENQVKYQVLLIQNRFYNPNNLTTEQKRYFKDIEKPMSFFMAEEIFDANNYKDPAMRGRTSIAPLKKMGFCAIMDNKIKITPLGDYFLSEDYDLGKVFFIHFLKWQLPNPASRSFSQRDGFSIKPFIGTLQLIKEVNKLWIEHRNQSIGISKEEFSLFTLTLINYKEIKKQANKLVEYRIGLREQKDEKDKAKFKENFKENLAREFIGSTNPDKIRKFLNNLKDYGDNAIRYFRFTRYIHIRGGGYYIDLEPRRLIEIERLLSTDDASPIKFKSATDYINYLADLEQPLLPWDNKPELVKIAEKLNQELQNYLDKLSTKSIKIPPFAFQEIKRLSVEQLKRYIDNLRVYLSKLHGLETNFKSQDISTIKTYINALKNIHQWPGKKSIELEKLATLALIALNDALKIKPNYPMGDDNEPTFTAPGNKPDIECFYKTFNSVCEVTMLTNRSQWYSEGQPVMRHVRDFEDVHMNKPVYCLFIAPRLHQDTVETFWVANTYQYRGTKQRIVPLSINQLINLLEILLEIRKQGKKFNHIELLKLFENILLLTQDVESSDNWIERIPETIKAWENSVLAR